MTDDGSKHRPQPGSPEGSASDKLWGGRFEGQTDAAVERFTASIQFDRALLRSPNRSIVCSVPDRQPSEPGTPMRRRCSTKLSLTTALRPWENDRSWSTRGAFFKETEQTIAGLPS